MSVWNMMADVFDFENKEIINFVYYNHSVERFLDSEHSMGVAACKGMGKTFLLKIKRMKLSQRIEGSAIILPKNQLVDTPGTILLDKMHIKFLSSYHNWIALWISCFAIYILSLDEIKSDFEEEFADLKDIIKDLINSKNNGVFHVLSKVLSMNSSKNLRIISQSSDLLFALLQQIHKPIYFFIDKIEEPFNRGFYKIPGGNSASEGRYNSSIWAYSQLSFSEAVYRLYSGRHHIKIFYGIRQEALYGGESISVEYSKVVGQMISKLEYSYEDLYKMFRIYVQAEKRKNLYNPSKVEDNPIEALCGVREIKHRSGVVEKAWAYLYRHSLQRPRDIMEMGMELYARIVKDPDSHEYKEVELIRRYRHWINQVATRQCMEYLCSLEPFMTYNENIEFKEKIIGFLKFLPTNIFNPKTIIEYCHKVNLNNEKVNCTLCNNIHYFSTLYNIGLIGYIYKSNSENGYKHKIKQLGDSIFQNSSQTLPSAELYYVHPGLGNIIENERKKLMRQYIPSLFIMNSSEIFIQELQIQKLDHLCNALFGNEMEKRVFLTSTGRDLTHERKKIKLLLEEVGYQVIGYEFYDFPQMINDIALQHYYAEAHDHCIDSVLSCKNLIYIFSGKFGETYEGKKYQSYIDNNKKVIDIKPSVSFVEYLIAMDYGKNVRVYVPNEVEIAYGEWKANGYREDYCSNKVDELKVLKQYGYLNALGNGTWIDKYVDPLMLEEYISNHFPGDFLYS